MSKKRTTNRWVVIYPTGEAVFLWGSYDNLYEVQQYIRPVRQHEAFAVRVPTFCYHPYADGQSRETSDLPTGPFGGAYYGRATGRGV